MHRPPDGPGWGVDRELAAEPLAADGALAERCKQLAWWHLLEARWSGGTDLDFAPEFRVPEARTESLGRLMGLLRELERGLLPCLARAVRCEAAQGLQWTHAPASGRVDPLRTVRADPLGHAAPRTWATVRVSRHADTPVNRFAAEVLRYTERLLRGLLALYVGYGRPAPRTVVAVDQALRRFMTASPLGEIAVDGRSNLAAVAAAASRRAAELRRLAPLARWWHDLQAVEMVALRQTIADVGLQDTSIHRCFELMHAMALLGAVRLRFAGDMTAVAGGVDVVANDLQVQLRFDARPPRSGRSPTAELRVARAGVVVRRLYVEARNADAAAAGPIAGQLELWCLRDSMACAVLVTPNELALPDLPAAGAAVELHASPLGEHGALPDLVGWWHRLLVRLLA